MESWNTTVGSLRKGAWFRYMGVTSRVLKKSANPDGTVTLLLADRHGVERLPVTLLAYTVVTKADGE